MNWCWFCSCLVSLAHFLCSYCWSPSSSSVQISKPFCTPNDIDFNFISRAVRLSHFTIKYLGRMFMHNENGWRDENYGECYVIHYTSIIKLDKIDTRTNKFDSWYIRIFVIFKHLHLQSSQHNLICVWEWTCSINLICQQNMCFFPCSILTLPCIHWDHE